MRRLLFQLAVVATALFALACGGSSERIFVNIGTAPAGGAFFVVGGALAEVMGAATADRGWQVNQESTSGSQENIRRLAQGELDFALSNAAITFFAVRGTEGWDRAYPVQSVMTLAPNVALFITKAGSGIARITDLRGKRVVIGPAGAGFEYFVRPIVEAHGVSYSDFTPLNSSQAAAVDMLTDGAADAVFLGGAVPTASISQAAASLDLVFIPFDPEPKGRLVADYLFFSPATIPAGTYRNQSEPYEGLDVGSMHLITAEQADEEFVYEVTKLLYERRDEVTAKHPAGRSINAANVVRDTGTSFHPGAIRFYREIGIWPN
ncbi:MAG TPA: TAXI family TRAP transporter solute-binding subunit [Vicinamibacterales bacterium]|nr:TAXI family TRAP transporter solute-binding subunit [Vicinamibacterales bacterium]